MTKVLSKEQLLCLKPATDEVPVPEAGEGAVVVVRGFTIGNVLAIQQACYPTGSDGKSRYDAKQDRLLSIIAAVSEPALTMEDTTRLLEVSDGIGDRIIDTARKLSGRNQSVFDDVKESMRRNPLLRRFYTVAVEKLGKFPSQLEHVTEMEFMTYLAAAEVEDEETESGKPQTKKGS